MIAGLQHVGCVIDHEHRNVWVAVDAVAGRFTHAGVTLDLGSTPAWRSCGLDHDEEWRIEFVKLYEGLDLAHAFGETRDIRYLTTWQQLVSSFVDQVPVGSDSSDVSARRIQNWIYAAQRFMVTGCFPGFEEGFEQLFEQRVSLDVQHLREHLTTERNHRTLELYALLVADLAFGRRDAARADLELLADNASTDIWTDGVHRECSSDYHLIVLRSLVGSLLNARIADIEVPAALVDRTNAAATFALWLHRPNGTTPALSDGDQGDFRSLMALAADVLERPDLEWVASDGRQGVAPETSGATFEVGGYEFWRADWSSAASAWGVFDCGPIGDGGHGHYDQLSVELFDGPRALVVDPGRYTYADDGPDGWRHWFKGTAAHNTLMVDGLDHVAFRTGKPKGDRSEARLLQRSRVAGLDVATGEVRSSRYEAVHVRSVALVDNSYWVIRDRVFADRCHRYEMRWHLDPRCAGSIVARRDPVSGWVDGPGLRLVVADLGTGELAIEDGWVSPRYGARRAAPVVVVAVDGGSNLDLVTLIGGVDAPDSITVECIDDELFIATRAGAVVHHLGWTGNGDDGWMKVVER